MGASGDLTPLSYVAAVMVGDRQVMHPGQRDLRRRGACTAHGITPLDARAQGRPRAHERHLRHDRALLPRLGAGRISVAPRHPHHRHGEHRAGQSNPKHFAPGLFAVKPHAGQQQVAAWIFADMGASERDSPIRIQDRYSIRCSPHVIGVLADALPWMRRDLENELNSANDNPIVDPDTGEIYHGGHFYGGHVAFVADSLKNAVANVADLLDRQLALLVDTRFNNGLPSNLSGARRRPRRAKPRLQGGADRGVRMDRGSAQAHHASQRVLPLHRVPQPGQGEHGHHLGARLHPRAGAHRAGGGRLAWPPRRRHWRYAAARASGRLRAWKLTSAPCTTKCSAYARSWKRTGRWSMSSAALCAAVARAAGRSTDSPRMRDALLTAEIELEVPFQDLDPMQIAWHGNYFRYFEAARVKLLRSDRLRLPGHGSLGLFLAAHRGPRAVRAGATLRSAHPRRASLTEWENRLKIEYLVSDAESGRRLTTGYTIQCAIEAKSGELQLVSPPALLDEAEEISMRFMSALIALACVGFDFPAELAEAPLIISPPVSSRPARCRVSTRPSSATVTSLRQSRRFPLGDHRAVSLSLRDERQTGPRGTARRHPSATWIRTRLPGSLPWNTSSSARCRVIAPNCRLISA